MVCDGVSATIGEANQCRAVCLSSRGLSRSLRKGCHHGSSQKGDRAVQGLTREHPMSIDISRRVVAEFFGTFWLVFAGCGAAVLAAGFPHLGIGFSGVAFAFGLTVLTMAYAVGHISGGHFNPAVTIGLWSAGRCAAGDVILYIIAQVVGAIIAAAVLWLIASGKPGWVAGGFAANGYGDLSPGKYGFIACLVTEVVMTFFFLYIIIGTTSKGAASG